MISANCNITLYYLLIQKGKKKPACMYIFFYFLWRAGFRADINRELTDSVVTRDGRHNNLYPIAPRGDAAVNRISVTVGRWVGGGGRGNNFYGVIRTDYFYRPLLFLPSLSGWFKYPSSCASGPCTHARLYVVLHGVAGWVVGNGWLYVVSYSWTRICMNSYLFRVESSVHLQWYSLAW